MLKFFFKLREVLVRPKKVKSPFWHLYNFLYRSIMVIYGSSISLNSLIKSPPNLVHGLHGIFISKNAIIGENVTIYQQVTIGSISSKGPRKGAPIIGDNVTLGPGCKILGNVRVGSGSRVMANCVIVDDIPENSFVFMEKPRVIRNSINKKE